MTPSGRVWIQGAGELASGVAFRLVRSGYRVILAEREKPLAVRRRVCFSEAVYTGRAEVEGVPGELVDPADCTYRPEKVSVVVDARGELLGRLGADAVVDARMTKRSPEPLPAAGIPVIGLGPGFLCGRDATFIVETHREARLGEVVSEGTAAPDTGVPGRVGGQAGLRVLKAPAAGHFTSLFDIGDLVEEGVVLGHIGGIPVVSPLAGRIRGLVHPEAELSAGMKVGDVDPRGSRVDPDLVSDKALAVAGGVLEALLRLKIRPTG